MPYRNKQIRNLLWLSNALFVLLYIVLSYYNRPAHDDFYTEFMYKTMGILKGVSYQYHHYCTRYFSVLISLLITKFSSNPYYLFVYNMVLLVLFVYSTCKFLFAFKVLKNEPAFAIINIAIFIVSAVFYTTFRIGETWFWLASSSAYAISAGVLILGLALLLDNKNKWYKYFGITLCFFFVGGSNEALSLLVILVLVLALLFSRFLKIPQPMFVKILAAMLSGSIGFAILFFGPGNAVRSTFFEEISVLHSFFLNFKITAIFFLLRLPFVLPIVLLFSLVLSNIISLEFNIKLNLKKKLLFGFCAFVIIVFLFLWPITYKTLDIAAYRTLFPLSIISLIFFSIVIAWLNKHPIMRFLRSTRVLYWALFFLVVAQISLMAYQYPTAKKYAVAHDERMNYLKENTNNTDTLWLAPLPNSGLLYTSEVSENPTFFTNQHMKKGLGLKAEVALKTH